MIVTVVFVAVSWLILTTIKHRPSHHRQSIRYRNPKARQDV